MFKKVLSFILLSSLIGCSTILLRIGKPRELEIVEAIKKGKVEAKTQGAGIEEVNMELKRLARYELSINIPVGTYFISHGSAQNMVGTTEETVILQDDDWHSISISVACANRAKDIPSEEETFDIQRSPHQAELKRLMPALRKANVDFAVQQAAVWIVTDDANYEDLGTLEGRYAWQLIPTRMIREYEAALAMKICDEAGIDITQKAIWRDRKDILKELEDEDLTNWLEQKAQQ